MKIVSAEQMKQIDRTAIDQRSIPSLRLMEHAGKAVAKAILNFSPLAKHIAVFVGKGNNGGMRYYSRRKVFLESGDNCSLGILFSMNIMRCRWLELIHLADPYLCFISIW